MFDIGGKPSDAFRREVDVYVNVDDVDELRRRLDGRVEVFENLHDTFYRYARVHHPGWEPVLDHIRATD